MVLTENLKLNMDAMYNDFSTAMIMNPEFTSPFWNMSRYEDGIVLKIDVILGGMETIGC